MNARRYLVLLAIVFSASVGDVLLSVGMKETGAISLRHSLELLVALRNPFIILGILCLLVFFGSYLAALSWADLTFVLPATSLGYVVVALLSKYALHEYVSSSRWLGIALISAGVGFVANGPVQSRRKDLQEPEVSEITEVVNS
ncbi:MAG TPA: EamA family transporter [Terriglobales bacterium]|nr:EamA family transporter [Terriglobales bacterium]